jgi:SNF2 family DNA or RNA helicase
MITIREDICKKLPGITSLFISFAFNQEIINLLKNCDAYIFDKKTLEWEVPINSLSYVLDNLVYYDDITLNLLKDKEIETNIIKPSLSYKLKPFDYQMEGITYGLNKDRWLLLDAPGLGKTAQIIHIAEELKASRGLKHCLIICGVASLKTNWKSEIEKHSDLTCRILGERVTRTGSKVIDSVEKRAEQLKNNIDEFFIITNIETFRSDSVLEAFKTGANEIDMIVVDEIHKAKSNQSQQGKNLLKIKDVKYKIGATGTLLLNNPLDAYVPLAWIGEEKATMTTFKYFYCEFANSLTNQVTGVKNMEILKNHINSCSLRRTKDLLNLPPKNIINEYVDMNDNHRRFYDDVRKGIKDEVDKVELTTQSILAMITRLRQATSSPSILSTSDIISSKIDRAVDLAEQVISNNDKIVIFSTFKETVYRLKELLLEYNPAILTGDTKEDDVERIKTKFQTDDTCKVFIGTWQKAGTGITLTAANYMIFIDTPWTYAEFEQSQDRIYRIGTSKSVFIYNLICKDTIDERVKDIVYKKQAISDYVIDDKLSEDSIKILKNYLTEEL